MSQQLPASRSRQSRPPRSPTASANQAASPSSRPHSALPTLQTEPSRQPSQNASPGMDASAITPGDIGTAETSAHGLAEEVRQLLNKLGEQEALSRDLHGAFNNRDTAEDHAVGILPRISHYLRKWPSTAASKEILRLCNVDTGADLFQNPIIKYYRSVREKAYTERQGQAYPEIPTLQKHFYETRYSGDAHEKLFGRLRLAEAYVTRSWKELDEQMAKAPEGVSESHREQEDGSASAASDTCDHKKGWYARSLSILQSSGMGKSRLLRELGHVSGGTQVSVLILCFREDYPGSEACVPAPDKALRDYLNDADVSNSVQAWFRWRLRWCCLFEAIWTEATALLDRPHGAYTWAAICDPQIVPEKIVKRRDFFNGVVKQSKHLMQSAIADAAAICGDDDEKLAPSTFRARAAAACFHQKQGRAWTILAIDEASGICPSKLLNTDGIAMLEPKVTDEKALKAACVAEIARLFSKPIYKEPAPERFWLLLADTNSAISTLMPPVSQSPSSRIQREVLRRLPPYCPILLDLGIEGRQAAMDYLLLSPLDASAGHILALKGRPLWQSLVEVVSSDSSISEQARTRSPNSSWTQEVEDPVSDQVVRCFATPRFALQKLLCWETGVSEWRLNRDRTMALLHQRIHIPTPMNSEGLSHRSEDAYNFNTKRVEKHLGCVDDVPNDGKQVHVCTAHEPLVSMAATAWLRTNGRNASGKSDILGPLLELYGTALWQIVWRDFISIIEGGQPMDRGVEGELSAQALCCIAHDLARRRHMAGVSLWKGAYRSASAFVHVEDLLAMLLPVDQLAETDRGQLDNLLAALGSEAWTSFERFFRLSDKKVNREDLVVAFQDRYAIVGAFNQPVWDLMIPVYCGALEDNLRPELFTWIQIQVKNKEQATGNKGMKAQVMRCGSLIPEDERVPEWEGDRREGSADTPPQDEEEDEVIRVPPPGSKPTAKDRFVPQHPPVMVWLEIGGQSSSRKPQKLPKIVPLEGSDWPYWFIRYPLFDPRNFPALKDWHGPFPLASANTAPSWKTWDESYRTEQSDALCRRNAYRDPRPAPGGPRASSSRAQTDALSGTFETLQVQDAAAR